MSSGQKPRTPEYFPRMNDRAYRRRARRRAKVEVVPSILRFTEAARRLGKALQQFGGSLRAGFTRMPRRPHYGLTPHPSVIGKLNAGPLQGAEPSLMILDEITHPAQHS
jgi:hypothetical protein